MNKLIFMYDFATIARAFNDELKAVDPNFKKRTACPLYENSYYVAVDGVKYDVTPHEYRIARLIDNTSTFLRNTNRKECASIGTGALSVDEFKEREAHRLKLAAVVNKWISEFNQFIVERYGAKK